jgi:hypothetical protein
MTGFITQTDINYTFKWEVQKFLDIFKDVTVRTITQSPRFKICDANNDFKECMLDIRAPFSFKDNKDSVGISLVCFQPNSTLSYSISIVNKSGVREELRKYESWKIKTAVRFTTFMDISRLKDNFLSNNGTLTIILDMYKPGPSHSVARFSDDLKKSFLEMKHPDRQLVCNGKKFGCNTFLLAARSPYFAAMFSSGFKEGPSSEIPIDFIQPDILEVIILNPF